MTRILIGSDPELFVTDEHGMFISGHDLIPGTKEVPHPVPRGAIQVDGVACEFNVDPAETKEEFSKSIRLVVNSMEEMIKNKHPGYSLEIVPTAYFNKAYFNTLPDDVRKLGCTPDFDAYTGEENVGPETTEPFRTGAGHIHVGWTENQLPDDEKHLKACRELTKELDCVLYPASLLWDTDEKRRTLYGRMGSFRPKSYGVEYRPLSNAYLGNKETQEYVFDLTKAVATQYFESSVRLVNDRVATGYVEDTLRGKSIRRAGLTQYLKYIGDTYGLPIQNR